MKKIFVAMAAFVVSASLLSAQDLSVATETFNQAATILNDENGDKAQALTLLQEALTQGEACGEEAADLVATCKKLIPEVTISIAKGLINEGNYDEAVAKLAEAEAKANEYEMAETAAEAKSLAANACLRKGSTLMKAKDFAGAAEALAKATEIDPTDGNAYLMLGQAQMQTGKLDDAIAALLKASENGKEAQANKLLSNAYLKKGAALTSENKTAAAVEAFEAANKYGENATAYKMLANSYNKLGKKKEAIAAAKKYLELSPDAKDAATYKQLIEVLSK